MNKRIAIIGAPIAIVVAALVFFLPSINDSDVQAKEPNMRCIMMVTTLYAEDLITIEQEFPRDTTYVEVSECEFKLDINQFITTGDKHQTLFLKDGSIYDGHWRYDVATTGIEERGN